MYMQFVDMCVRCWQDLHDAWCGRSSWDHGAGADGAFLRDEAERRPRLLGYYVLSRGRNHCLDIHAYMYLFSILSDASLVYCSYDNLYGNVSSEQLFRCYALSTF